MRLLESLAIQSLIILSLWFAFHPSKIAIPLRRTIMALTKKQEQELRAAQAEEARIAKLEEQLAAAKAKVAERANKRRDDIKRAIERKEVARKAQLDLITKANEAVSQIDNDIEILTDQLDEDYDVDDEEAQDD